MNFDYSKYKYTQKWFNEKTELKQHLHKYIDPKKILCILEIGNFEGLSSSFFSDNYLDHTNSKLYCVDPFYISNTISGITSLCINSSTEKLFHNNISKSKYFNKINTYKLTSDDFFKQNNHLSFDIIYVDGNHEEEYIKNDLQNAFKYINIEGIIWFDDYGGNISVATKLNEKKISTLIDKYLNNYKDRFIIINKGYQLGLKIIK